MDFEIKLPFDTLIDYQEFKEFDQVCRDIQVISEAVEGADSGSFATTKKIVSNTAKTTGDIGKLYGKTTDTGAAAISSVWDLFMKLAGLAAKAISFTVKQLVKIPKALNKAIDGVTSIPSNVKAKIRGDIRLNITINDLQVIHNQMVLHHMMNLMSLTSQFSHGDTWTSFWNKDKSRTDDVEANDKKLLSKMQAEFNYFSHLKITPTTVNMSDAKVVEGYFGNGRISYKDIKGEQHNDTYYDALKNLVKEITENKTNLDQIYNEIGDKIQRTQENGQFAKLSNARRQAIIHVMQMLSSTASLIGNIVKAIMQDIQTIQKTTEEIINAQNKTSISGVKKKLVGRDDNAVKDLDINKDPNDDKSYEKVYLDKGYVKIPRYSKDKSGRVVQEYQGEVHKFNDEIVWVKKENVPRGVKIIK